MSYYDPDLDLCTNQQAEYAALLDEAEDIAFELAARAETAAERAREEGS